MPLCPLALYAKINNLFVQILDLKPKLKQKYLTFF